MLLAVVATRPRIITTGFGALQAGAATVAGLGAVDSGSGILAAGAATVAGAGISSSTGTGDLAAGAATIAGAGTAGSAAALDGYTTGLTAAYSASRQLLTAYGGTFYTAAGGLISALNDQSGNSRNFTQATGSLQPAEGTGGPNSRAWVDFDGSDDLMGTTATFADVCNNNSGWIACSVIVDASTTNSATIFQNTAILRDGGAFMGIHLKSAPTVHAYNFDTTADSDSAAFVVGTAYVFSWRHDGGNLFVGVNDTEGAGVASGNTGTITGVMQLATAGGGVAKFNGKIFELVIYDTVPSAGDRTAIITALKDWVGA